MDDITHSPPQKPSKKRKLSLTKADRAELALQKQIELAVSLFLDLDQDRTVQQIAEEMGMTVSSLKRLTQTAKFQETYDGVLMQLGHHPRLQALQGQLPELIPLSYQAMRRLLSPGTAHTAQVAAVKLLWDTLHLGDQNVEEDPALLNNFMKSAGVHIENNVVINTNLPIPEEYQAAFQRLMGADIVDVKAEDVPTLPSPTPETVALQPPGESG